MSYFFHFFLYYLLIPSCFLYPLNFLLVLVPFIFAPLYFFAHAIAPTSWVCFTHKVGIQSSKWFTRVSHLLLLWHLQSLCACEATMRSKLKLRTCFSRLWQTFFEMLSQETLSSSKFQSLLLFYNLLTSYMFLLVWCLLLSGFIRLLRPASTVEFAVCLCSMRKCGDC